VLQHVLGQGHCCWQPLGWQRAGLLLLLLLLVGSGNRALLLLLRSSHWMLLAVIVALLACDSRRCCRGCLRRLLQSQLAAIAVLRQGRCRRRLLLGPAVRLLWLLLSTLTVRGRLRLEVVLLTCCFCNAALCACRSGLAASPPSPLRRLGAGASIMPGGLHCQPLHLSHRFATTIRVEQAEPSGEVACTAAAARLRQGWQAQLFTCSHDAQHGQAPFSSSESSYTILKGVILALGLQAVMVPVYQPACSPVHSVCGDRWGRQVGPCTAPTP